MPSKAKSYISLIIVLGLPLGLYSLYRSVLIPDLRWLYLLGLAVVGSCFPVKVPLLKTKTQSLTVSVSEVFVFIAILVFGPYLAATIALVEGLVSGLRVKVKRLYKHLFNLSQLALVAFAVGQVYYVLESRAASLNSPQGALETLLVKVIICGLLYFLLNSAAVAMAMAFVTEQPLFPLWRENFLWTSTGNFINASTAAVAFAYFRPLDFYIAIPVILVFYYAYQTHLRRS